MWNELINNQIVTKSIVTVNDKEYETILKIFDLETKEYIFDDTPKDTVDEVEQEEIVEDVTDDILRMTVGIVPLNNQQQEIKDKLIELTNASNKPLDTVTYESHKNEIIETLQYFINVKYTPTEFLLDQFFDYSGNISFNSNITCNQFVKYLDGYIKSFEHNVDGFVHKFYKKVYISVNYVDYEIFQYKGIDDLGNILGTNLHGCENLYALKHHTNTTEEIIDIVLEYTTGSKEIFDRIEYSDFDAPMKLTDVDQDQLTSKEPILDTYFDGKDYHDMTVGELFKEYVKLLDKNSIEYKIEIIIDQVFDQWHTDSILIFGIVSLIETLEAKKVIFDY